MAKTVQVTQRIGSMLRRRAIKDQDKEFHYRYVRNDSDRIEDIIHGHGYEVVSRNEKGDLVKGDEGNLDGAVTAGGDILVRVPMEVWRARLKEKEAITKAFTEGAGEAFKTAGMKADVKTIDNSTSKEGPMSSVLGNQK